MITKAMRTKQTCPVRDAAAMHGAVIPNALIYAGVVLVIEQSSASPHDGYVHVVGPNPPINDDGTYLKSGKEAWVELAHLAEISQDHTVLQIDIDWTNKTWTTKEG